MITNIIIEDSSNSPFKYIDDNRSDNFNLKNEYTFTSNVNILIGSNGCGKSTLLNIIKEYTLSKREIFSQLPSNNLGINTLFDSNGNLLDGIKVFSNYACSIFNLRFKNELNNESSQENIENFSQFLNSTSLSEGEGNLHALQILFSKMFDGKSIYFPIKKIKSYAKDGNINEYWQKKYLQLYNYYMSNHIEGSNITMIMDEPERNLDIDNCKEIYGILSNNRPDIQIIASIHNPLMIYKLSKNKDVNFIEMSPNYLKKVIDFVEL